MQTIAVPKILLAEIVKSRALTFGDFTLKSGKKSNFYLDLRKLHLSPAVNVVAQAVRHELIGFEYDAIGGPCIGADPLVGAYLSSMALLNADLRGFLVRKEEKEHGIKDLVIGSIKPGDRCVMLEDVSTTGGSMMKAIEAVHAFGAKVVLGISVVDRSHGAAAELLNSHGIGFKSLLTLEDLDIKE